jgi:hypothetical protein
MCHTLATPTRFALFTPRILGFVCSPWISS